MGKFVLRDAVIDVDGTDLSQFASSVTIESPADEVDLTTFQGGGYREFGQGLKDATITITFFQDFDSASVDAVLEPLHTSGDTFVLKVKADDAVTSATNPEFEMTSRLFNYNPIAGAVGEASTADVTFRNASSTGITRNTS